MRVLVTGASGFIGGGVIRRLAETPGVEVRAASRRATVLPRGVAGEFVPDLSDHTDWRVAVRGTDAVIHTAARVHVVHEHAANALHAFRAVNVAGTLTLARQAAQAGVRRFIFVSSIKVNGEQTAHGHPFTAESPAAPEDPYGISKHEAEQGLRGLASDTGMEVVIIRPVLVYGPGVKANFRAILQAVHRGLPLPLGAVRNRRSLVALENLVDLIRCCLDHPAAANQNFLVSDDEDLSTTELVRRLGHALGRRARLFPVPVVLVEAASALVGKRAIARRLCASLTVDVSGTRGRLGWSPPVTVDQALRVTAAWFLEEERRR